MRALTRLEKGQVDRPFGVALGADRRLIRDDTGEIDRASNVRGLTLVDGWFRLVKEAGVEGIECFAVHDWIRRLYAGIRLEGDDRLTGLAAEHTVGSVLAQHVAE